MRQSLGRFLSERLGREFLSRVTPISRAPHSREEATMRTTVLPAVIGTLLFSSSCVSAQTPPATPPPSPSPAVTSASDVIRQDVEDLLVRCKAVPSNEDLAKQSKRKQEFYGRIRDSLA